MRLRKSKKAEWSFVIKLIAGVVFTVLILASLLGPKLWSTIRTQIEKTDPRTGLDPDSGYYEDGSEGMQTELLAASYNALVRVLSSEVKFSDDFKKPACRLMFIPAIPAKMKEKEHIRLEQKLNSDNTPYIEVNLINERGASALKRKINNRILCAVAGKDISRKWSSELFYKYIFEMGPENIGPSQKAQTYNEYDKIEIKEGNPKIILYKGNSIEERELEAPRIFYIADDKHYCFIPTKDGDTFGSCDGSKVLDDDCLTDKDEGGLVTINSKLKDCEIVETGVPAGQQETQQYEMIINLGKFNDNETLAQLIGDAKSGGRTLAKRIAYISEQFNDVKREGDTLKGSPTVPEKLVVNLEEVDCFTLLDYVMAFALAEHVPDNDAETVHNFYEELRKIRYKDGIISYENRNHFLTDWLSRNQRWTTDYTAQIGNGVEESDIKTLNIKDDGSYWLPGVPNVEREITYIPREDVDNNVAARLREGDIIGFYTSQKGLDVTHVGIIYEAGGKKMFRHASKDPPRTAVVDDETLQEYLNRIKSKEGIVVMRPR